MSLGEHAVLVYLQLSNKEFGDESERDRITSLEERLESILTSKGVGEFDGSEVGMGTCTLYMYGQDADLLFGTVEDALREGSWPPGSYAIKRYGPAHDPSSKEVRVPL